MTAPFTESTVEQAALVWLESAGWSVRNGAEIAPKPTVERDDYGQVILWITRPRDGDRPAESAESGLRG